MTHIYWCRCWLGNADQILLIFHLSYVHFTEPSKQYSAQNAIPSMHALMPICSSYSLLCRHRLHVLMSCWWLKPSKRERGGIHSEKMISMSGRWSVSPYESSPVLHSKHTAPLYTAEVPHFLFDGMCRLVWAVRPSPKPLLHVALLWMKPLRTTPRLSRAVLHATK